MSDEYAFDILRLAMFDSHGENIKKDASTYLSGWRANFLSHYPEVRNVLLEHDIPHKWRLVYHGLTTDSRFGEELLVVVMQLVVTDLTKAVYFKLWFDPPDLIEYYIYKPEKPPRVLCEAVVNLEI